MWQDEASAHPFAQSSFFSMVHLEPICSNKAGTSELEMSSPVYLYILLAAIETKGLASISLLKCVNP